MKSEPELGYALSSSNEPRLGRWDAPLKSCGFACPSTPRSNGPSMGTEGWILLAIPLALTYTIRSVNAIG